MTQFNTNAKPKASNRSGITQETMAGWLKSGKISYLQVESNLRYENIKYEYGGGSLRGTQTIKEELAFSPLAEKIMFAGWSVGFQTILKTSGSEPYFFPGVDYLTFFYERSKPGALMTPLMEQKEQEVAAQVEVKKAHGFSFKEFFGVGKKPAIKQKAEPKSEYVANFDKRSVVIMLISGLADDLNRDGVTWKLGLQCDSDVGDRIFAAACGSEEAAFHFFVDAIPGFALIEGTDFGVFSERSNVRKRSGFTAGKATTPEEFAALPKK